MSTPIDPSPIPGAPPVATPTPGAGALEEEIRQLATQLAQPQLSFDPSTVRKGEVTAISLGSASVAPSVTVNIGASGVLVPGIRIAANYSPQVGDTVLLVKQGAETFAAFKIADEGSSPAHSLAGGWTKADLVSGVTHAGNSGGDVMWRRVNRDGSWLMEWQGTCALNASQTQLLATLLPTECRPSIRRTVPVVRTPSQGHIVCYLDFSTTAGGATIIGGTTATSLGSTDSTGQHSHYQGNTDTRLSGYLSSNGSDLGHFHGQGYGESLGNHSHGMGTTVPNHPDWISFDNVSYYL